MSHPSPISTQKKALQQTTILSSQHQSTQHIRDNGDKEKEKRVTLS